ncbi:hypothetical protein Microterr_00600 [Microbacterium terricola]|uniref:Uncharacterized protein n=1 Tax=Microbacterium terricola TaxID=344163 RepID=A0ABM8DV59_9MICO|nr:hypothetical protein Microterr_00600 [Microbacterium terricola]
MTPAIRLKRLMPTMRPIERFLTGSVSPSASGVGAVAVFDIEVLIRSRHAVADTASLSSTLSGRVGCHES